MGPPERGLRAGEGARCTARALAAAGVHVQWRDLPLATHINDQPLPESGDWEPAAIDLVHTNPNVLRQTDGLLERLELRAPLRIGYWAWELEAFPSGWEAGFAGLDQLWCPSTFTAQALALRSPVPVSALPHLIDWRRADRLAQRRLTVPPAARSAVHGAVRLRFLEHGGAQEPGGGDRGLPAGLSPRPWNGSGWERDASPRPAGAQTLQRTPISGCR
ncbi:hypothetical protein [Cyanobium sp. ATX-6F1]|uniref:hypothetical protein n=1 Tax=Cyanobium sp. ATX-6F1 TaxID=3137388 RepID=UPI0039BE80A0